MNRNILCVKDWLFWSVHVFPSYVVLSCHSRLHVKLRVKQWIDETSPRRKTGLSVQQRCLFVSRETCLAQWSCSFRSERGFVDATGYSSICVTRDIQHPLLHSVPSDLLHALVVNLCTAEETLLLLTAEETLLLLSVNPTALYLGYGA